MAFLLLVNTCALGLMKIGFELNRDYFETNFCVNKRKPALNCHASCHLTKSLKKVQDNQATEQGKEGQNTLISVNFILSEGVHLATSFLIAPDLKHFTTHNVTYSFLSVLSVFHPPAKG